MNELVYNQIFIFIIFILTGVCIGLLFDSFRIQRRIFKANNLITYIQDILFWIFTGLLLSYMLIKYTDGIIRFYMLQGLIIGLFMYFMLVSKFVLNIVSVTIKSVISFFKSIILHKKITKKD